MARQLILLSVLLLGVGIHETFADEPEKIVGGSDAALGEFAHQVSLQFNGQHFCGGSLITNRHVLTAAHCVYDLPDPKMYMTVVTGTNSIKEGGERHKIKDVIIHNNYINKGVNIVINDVAVIALAAPITPNAYQRTIEIATTQPPERAEVAISGWGQLHATGPIPDILQKANVYVLSNGDCQFRLRRNDILQRSNICVLYGRGVGACSGDSGGPLTYKGQLVGVASMAYPCARGMPDLYIRPSHYMDFINDAISRI